MSKQKVEIFTAEQLNQIERPAFIQLFEQVPSTDGWRTRIRAKTTKYEACIELIQFPPHINSRPDVLVVLDDYYNVDTVCMMLDFAKQLKKHTNASRMSIVHHEESELTIRQRNRQLGWTIQSVQREIQRYKSRLAELGNQLNELRRENMELKTKLNVCNRTLTDG